MKKLVFVTNGTGGCGKDTFARILNNYIPVYKCSSVDLVKVVARFCGWDGSKNEKDRKFLSDLKLLTTEYNDMPMRSLRKNYRMFMTDTEQQVMLIDIREPEEIDKAKKEFGARAILIRNDRVKPITTNMADANVENYNYDIVIDNNGTLDDFDRTIRTFISEYIEKE